MGCGGVLTDLADEHYGAGQQVRQMIGDPSITIYVTPDGQYHRIDNTKKAQFSKFEEPKKIEAPKSNNTINSPPPTIQPAKELKLINHH